jgi:predicted amidohydrolase
LSRKLRVAAVQTLLHRTDDETAVAEAKTLVETAAAKGARLVCLPEHWLWQTVNETGSHIVGDFRRLSRNLGVHINLGGIYYQEGGDIFLVSPTISSDGRVVSVQKKVHLFERERKKAKPGDSLEPFVLDGVRVGVLVCHDVVFPECARTLVLRGAEVLLNPSLIVSAGTVPWLTYLIARALENRVPIVAPNVYVPSRTEGESAIMIPRYLKKKRIMVLEEILAGKGRRVVIAEVDIEALRGARAERLEERRPEAYGN